MNPVHRRRAARLLLAGAPFLILLFLVATGAASRWVSRPLDTGAYTRMLPSGELRDPSGRLLFAYLNADEQWCFRRPLGEISPWLAKATVAVEDQRFHDHRGIDPVAVLRASLQNLRAGRYVSGASTLTMQLVKRAGGSDRTLGAKARQALDALRLDHHLGKDAQLDAYLNTAPYGLNLTGAEAGARRYFGKSAAELTLPEAALLAGLPKAPSRYQPLRDPAAALARRNHVLDRMFTEKMIRREEWEAARGAALGAAWNDFPALARHLAERLRPEAAGGRVLTLTIDAALQNRTERYLARALRRFDNDITNGAIIIVDVPTASVLARVGSASFFDTPGGGQVDATRAPRSPGSTLKPFTYALAVEHQMLYPGEMLHDGTLDLGLYNPENFDGMQRGLVSADYALKRSLNVPAVMVLGRLGPEPVHGLLRDLGLTTLGADASHYGLGLTLGNCECTLDELARAYTALAALGVARPLRHRADDLFPEGRRVLSRGTSLALYAMMEQPLPFEFDKHIVQARGGGSRLCWKTGTSTGGHDAWAFVFNSQYVVGVWLGNNDGRPSRRLVGARSALPIAGSVFRALPANPGASWPTPGDDLRVVEVCATTGLPASDWCPHRAEALVPRDSYLHRVCDVHRPGPEGGVTERWPGAASGWDLARVGSAAMPAMAKAAGDTAAARALRILEPADGARFVLTGEEKGDRVRLKTSVDATAALHWYLNGRYLGPSSPGSPRLLPIGHGAHTLTCMTADGATDTVAFEVAAPDGPLAFRPGA